MSIQSESLSLPGAGRNGSQRGALEKSHFNVAGKNVVTQEPTLVLDAIERRVPPHRFEHVRHVGHDERVETLADVALPTWHGRDVGLHGSNTVTLWNLRIAA